MHGDRGIEISTRDGGEHIDEKTDTNRTVAEQATRCPEQEALEEEIVIAGQERDGMVRRTDDVARLGENLSVERGVF